MLRKTTMIAYAFLFLFIIPTQPLLSADIASPSSRSAAVKPDLVPMLIACWTVADSYNAIVQNCHFKDMGLRMILLPSFEELRMKLSQKAVHGSAQEVEKLCDVRYVTKQLEETLPTCPVCFELFSDQFDKGSNGKHHVLRPCQHALCTVCLEGIQATCQAQRWQLTCPLCSKDIES